MSDLKGSKKDYGLVCKAATTNQGSVGGRQLRSCGATPQMRAKFILQATLHSPTPQLTYYSFHGFTDLRGLFAGLVVIS